MLRRSVMKSLAATTALVAAPAVAQSVTEIVVEYSIPDLFKTLHEAWGVELIVQPRGDHHLPLQFPQECAAFIRSAG